MKICGIDPGFSGGISIFDDRNLIDFIQMPIKIVSGIKKDKKKIDGVVLSRFLKKHEIDQIVIEQVHAFPGQGGVGNFSFGQNFGTVLGIIECLELSYLEVSPIRWKNKLFGKKQKIENEIFEQPEVVNKKEESIKWVLDKFPKINIKKSERSKKYHDGLADAICIGYYYFIKDE